jgi:LysM repeat protein
MRNYKTLWLLAMSCLSILLLTTGCFQPAGEGLQATSVAQGATFTPSPTLEAPTEAATELIIAEAFGTPTPETFGSVNGTDQNQGGGEAVAQAQDDSPAQTATAIIVAATERAAFNLTATALAFTTPTPTLAPLLPTATPTLNVGTGGTGGPCSHVVQQGDNLFRISLRYNVPIQTIATANNILNINIIKIGDTLNVPGCNSGGDFGTGGPIGSGQGYTVMQGDTLFKLSMQYGVTVHQIAAANGIPNINLIYIGQQLVIPAA